MEVEGMEAGYAVFDSSMGVQMEKSKSSTTAYLVKVGPLVCVLLPFLVGLALGVFVVPHEGGAGCDAAMPHTNDGAVPVGSDGSACPVCPVCTPCVGGTEVPEFAAVPLSEIQAVSVDAAGGDRSQYEGQMVQVQGLVEAVHDNGFFVIDESHTGLYVYVDPHDADHPWPTAADGTALAIGDLVQLQGEIMEYYGVTELTRLVPEGTRVVSRGNVLPEPFMLGPNELSEEHEGVMVSVEGVCVFHDIGHGEWVIRVSGTTDTTIIIDDMLDDDMLSAPEYNQRYLVEGIGHFSFGEYKIEATSVQELGDGTLDGPEGEYVPPPPPEYVPPPPPLAPSPPAGGGGPASPCQEVPTVALSDIQAVSVDADGNDHSPYEGQVVKVNALVLGVHDNGFFIQDASDFGLYVYIDDNLGVNFGWPQTAAGIPVEVGDRVELQGEILEYYGVTELTRVELDHSRIISHGNPLPLPFSLRTHELSEEHEGVLVAVSGTCSFHDIGHGEWVLNDGELAGHPGVVIDDMLEPGIVVNDVLDMEATPEYNRRYRIEGIGHFSYGQYKIEAISITDIGQGRLTEPEGDYHAEPPPPPACPAGTYSVAEGCEACAAGTADLDSDPFTPCVPCSVGEYAAASSTTCTVCADAGQVDDDRDPSTPCVDEDVCIQYCEAGYEDADCADATACTPCPPHTWSTGGTSPDNACTACGKNCPPPAPPPPPPPPTCDRVMDELGPTHSRHDWRTLPALPCLEVPPCSSGRSVFAELDYIVQDGLDHPRGDGQQWPLPDDFNAEDAIQPTSAELCWLEEAGSGRALKVQWESTDAAAELSTQTGCRDPTWEQDSVELYLSLGPEDPQTYLELDVAPAGGFFGGLIHNPTGRTGNDAFALGVDSTTGEAGNPWAREGVDCTDPSVVSKLAGVHWNVTVREPTIGDLATLRADLTVPLSALKGQAAAAGQSFGVLDGATGAGGPDWVSEWYDDANSEPDDRVMREYLLPARPIYALLPELSPLSATNIQTNTRAPPESHWDVS